MDDIVREALQEEALLAPDSTEVRAGLRRRIRLRHRHRRTAAIASVAAVTVVIVGSVSLIGGFTADRNATPPAVELGDGTGSATSTTPTTAGSTSTSADTASASPTADQVPPPPQVLGERPEFDDQGLSQPERDRRRALLTPYFRQFSEIDGFVDATFDLAARELSVLWYQQVPPQAQLIADDAVAAGHRVVLEPVAYTDRGIRAAAEQLGEVLLAAGIDGRAQVAEDFRSVEVSTPMLAETPALQARVADIATPVLGPIPLAMFSTFTGSRSLLIEPVPDSPVGTSGAYELLQHPAQSSPDHGFVDGRVDMNSHYVVIWWNRNAPPADRMLLDQLTSAGFTVAVRPVDEVPVIPLNQLTLVCKVLTTFGTLDGDTHEPADHPEVSECGPSADQRGIDLAGPGLAASTDLQRQIEQYLDERGYYGHIQLFFVEPGTVSAPAVEPSEGPVDSAADPLLDRARSLEGFVDGGVGIDGSPDLPAALTVVWEGNRTEDLEQLLVDAEDGGVTVSLIEQTYTDEQTTKVGSAIVDALKVEGIEVNRFGPSEFYRGLKMGGPLLSFTPELQERALEIAEPLLDGMPLVFDDRSGEIQDMVDGVESTTGN